MSHQRTARRLPIRSSQRLVHLVASVGILYYVYATPPADAISAIAVRWVVMPILFLSGLVMWQWPKLRRRIRAAGRGRAEAAR